MYYRKRSLLNATWLCIVWNVVLCFLKFAICLSWYSSHFGRNNEQLLSRHPLSSTHDFISFLGLVFSKLKNFSLFDFFHVTVSLSFFFVFFEHYYMLLEIRRPGVTHSIQDTRAVKIMVFMSLSSSFLIIPVIYLFCFVREVRKQINWALLNVVLLNIEQTLNIVFIALTI